MRQFWFDIVWDADLNTILYVQHCFVLTMRHYVLEQIPVFTGMTGKWLGFV